MSLLNRYTLLLILLILCILQYLLFTFFFAEVSSEKLSLTANKYNEGFRQKVKTSLRSTITTTSDVQPNDNSIQTQVSDQVKSSIPMYQHRIAVLLPYIGKSLPAWFDLFAFTAHSSASLIDWFIFITEAPTREVPSNVHMIRLSRKDMFQRFARLDEDYTNTTIGRTTLESYFQYIIDVHPYILVEIKPALGYLFADYVNGYSHWAYADLDLLMGRAQLHLTPDVLTKYDITTLAFGDNNRLYMRGQFTLHKNNERVRNLWKKCRYLSHVGERMEAFFVQKQHWDFQSAEGCYSKVVADEVNLSVLYLPVQFSDAFPGSLDEKETLLLGSSLLRCYEAPVNANIMHHGYNIKAHAMPVIGTTKGIEINRKSAHCSYWIRPDMQVCTEFVPGNATIRIEDGLMTYFIEDRYNIEHCKEASIAHFQVWKREYFSYTARIPSGNAHAMVVSEVGVIPLVLPAQSSTSAIESDVGVRDYASLYEENEKSMTRMPPKESTTLQIHQQQSSYLSPGRIRRDDMRSLLGPVKQHSLRRFHKKPREFSTIHRLLGRAARSTGRSSTTAEHSSHVKPAKAQQTDTERNQLDSSSTEVPVSAYCLRFSLDLKKCELPLLGRDIQVYPADSVDTELQRTTAITLVTTGWLAHFHAGRYDELLTHWDGPKVLVLARTGQEGSGEPSNYHTPHRSDTSIVLVDISAAGQPAHVKSHQSNATFWRLPEKTLFNMGLDAVDSDLVLLVPSHVALKKLSPGAETTAAEWTDLTAADVIQSFRHAEASLQEEEDSVTPALVLPVYLAHSQDPGQPLLPYPSHPAVGADGQCGLEQPPSMLPPLVDPDAARTGLQPLNFHAQELSLRRTLMLPVVFNASASPHGAGFVRFPEELNGVGCHGAFLLRVLSGSGYKLFWSARISGRVAAATPSTDTSSFQHTTLVTVVDANINTTTTTTWTQDCECVSSPLGDPAAATAEEAKVHNMIARINRYFNKAVELRKLGLSNTYSRTKFGVSFERDQLLAA